MTVSPEVCPDDEQKTVFIHDYYSYKFTDTLQRSSTYTNIQYVSNAVLSNDYRKFFRSLFWDIVREVFQKASNRLKSLKFDQNTLLSRQIQHYLKHIHLSV